MTELLASTPATPAGSDRTTARLFFGTGAGVSAASALMYCVVPMHATLPMRALAVGACLLLAVIFGVGAVLSRKHRMDRVVLGTGWATVLSIFVVSVSIGDGLQAPNLGFLATIVCVVAVLTDVRESLRIALGSATAMLALAWAAHAQWLPAAHPGAPELLPVHLLMQLMVLVAAWVAGLMMSKLVGRTLAEVLEREQRFRGLLRIAVDRYWETDTEFRFTRASYQNPDGVLTDSPEFIGRTPWGLGHVGLSDEAMAAFADDMRAHRPFANVVAQFANRSGKVRHVNLSGEPKFDAAGAFCGYWGVGRDVSAQVQAQRAVRASEGRYQDLFSRSPAPLVLHRDGIVIDANDAAARLFGHVGAQSMLGSVLHDLHTSAEAAQASRARTVYLEALPGGASIPVADHQLRALDGRQLTVQVRVVRVDTANGPASLSMYHDITALAAAEAALRRSETTLSHVFSTSPDAISLTELGTGRYVMVNDSFTRLLGYSAQDVAGRTSMELGLWHSPRDREHVVGLIRERGSASDLRARFVTKSGALITLQYAAASFAMDGRELLVINLRDVTATERTRLEHEAILQRASIGIAFTRGGRFVQVNPRFEDMFGWPQAGLAGQPGSVIWLDEADYDDVGRVARPLLSAGQPVEFERQVRRRDGSLFWCRLLAQVVDRSDPSAGGTVWIAEDITERRQAERALATARDAAEAANRAKSAFLANTSHEIRTPLNGLLGMARMAMEAGLDETRRQACLQQVFDSAQSLAGIISDILDLSKEEAGKLALETLPFGLRDTLRSVHRAYLALAEAKGLELTLDIAHSVPDTVIGDPVRVRQILSNFVTNAIKFTERGRVGIEASSLGDGRVRLGVRDTGVGIAEDTLAQLFVPFSQGDQSITRRFGGTGLGLSICRELAHLMKGLVGAESEVGRGSWFWADLPLPRGDSVVALPDTETDDLRRLRGAKVLLAEDNPVNMMIGVAMLEGWGVHVTQAVDGALAVQAVERAASAGRPFDLVLMDVQMPQMSGYAAARVLRVRHDRARLPIVALTAAALVSEREEALAAGMNDFLTKPIDAARLRHALATHLRAMVH